MGLAALASIFAGLSAHLTPSSVPFERKQGKPKPEINFAGSKLAKKIAQGRLGLTHPTRGTMATPKGLRPFSQKRATPLSPMLPKPLSHRQWKKRHRALAAQQ